MNDANHNTKPPFAETDEYKRLDHQRVIDINAAWGAFCRMRDSMPSPPIAQVLSRGYDAKQAQIEAAFFDEVTALFLRLQDESKAE